MENIENIETMVEILEHQENTIEVQESEEEPVHQENTIEVQESEEEPVQEESPIKVQGSDLEQAIEKNIKLVPLEGTNEDNESEITLIIEKQKWKHIIFRVSPEDHDLIKESAWRRKVSVRIFLINAIAALIRKDKQIK